MAPCCEGFVTPKMIKRGQVSIGDKIHLDDILASSDEIELKEHDKIIPVQAVSQTVAQAVSQTVAQAVSQAVSQAVTPAKAETEVKAEAAAETVPAAMTTTVADTQNTIGDTNTRNQQENMPQKRASVRQSVSATPPVSTQGQNIIKPSSTDAYYTTIEYYTPLIYDQMTDYSNYIGSEDTVEGYPTYSVPSSPLVPPEYEQTLNYESVQYFNGFLRTQIGRYVRIEQLLGADIIEDRYGFLVGMGANYVLLQEVASGNILAFDFYSIKSLYIYYTKPSFPETSNK